MRKLAMQLDELQVESFETGEAQDRHGTVRGHDDRVTEFCPTPFKPCKPTQACPTSVNCARHDEEPQVPPV